MGKMFSKQCVDLVKSFEGLFLKSYTDPVGVWTIGYGITNSDKAITGTTIKAGMTITEQVADEWLEASLAKKYLPLVLKYDNVYDWNQNELDALVSFCYNIGSIDQLTAKGTRSKSVISDKMLEYNKAGGKVFYGLTRRRKAEREMFLKSVEKKGYTGTFPALPPRGYYQEGDGITTLTNYPTQIKRVQSVLVWAGFLTGAVDGKYGPKTTAAVKACQIYFDLPVNGKFGNLCLGKLKSFKK